MNYYSEKSTVAEHSIEERHKILFEETGSLHPENIIYNRIVLESVEIELNVNTMNKKSGFVLSDRWKVLLRSISKFNGRA